MCQQAGGWHSTEMPSCEIHVDKLNFCTETIGMNLELFNLDMFNIPVISAFYLDKLQIKQSLTFN